MRPAARAWEEDYAERMAGEGYVRGRSAATVFHNREKEARVVVHGDDFTFLAGEEELRRMATKMAEWCEIVVRAVLGPGGTDDKVVNILNRTARPGKPTLEGKSSSRCAWRSTPSSKNITG